LRGVSKRAEGDCGEKAIEVVLMRKLWVFRIVTTMFVSGKLIQGDFILHFYWVI
jgi:hypothetical protein